MSGFRKGRNVVDNIVELENSIQTNLNTGLHTLALFLDIEKAYDKLWIEGLMFKLAQIGIRGKMYTFLEHYLENRTFQVKVGQTKSQIYEQCNGLPQGSALSPLLFNIMMKDIPVVPGIQISLYADDCAVWISGMNLFDMTEQLQNYIGILQNWFHKWRFKLSVHKTVPVLFTRSIHVEYPILKINDEDLMFKESQRFLGMIFDKHLTWQKHIENIVLRCKRKLNILRTLTKTEWGSSSKSLLMVYRAMIRPLLDYGCEAYNSASDTVKKPLNSIQFQALRICAGALPSTPLASLQVEMGEMPLDIRRNFMTEKYKFSLQRHLDHPLLKVFRPDWQVKLIMKCKAGNRPFACRISNIDSVSVEPFLSSPLPPWLLSPAHISIELSQEFTKDNNPAYLQQKSIELIQKKWSAQLHIFTDGSKATRFREMLSGFLCTGLFILTVEKTYRFYIII